MVAVPVKHGKSVTSRALCAPCCCQVESLLESPRLSARLRQEQRTIEALAGT
jgi:hypothetical protein